MFRNEKGEYGLLLPPSFVTYYPQTHNSPSLVVQKPAHLKNCLPPWHMGFFLGQWSRATPCSNQPLEANQCFLKETTAHSFLEEYLATKFCGTVRFPIISYLPAILDPFLGIEGETGINEILYAISKFPENLRKDAQIER